MPIPPVPTTLWVAAPWSPPSLRLWTCSSRTWLQCRRCLNSSLLHRLNWTIDSMASNSNNKNSLLSISNCQEPGISWASNCHRCSALILSLNPTPSWTSTWLRRCRNQSLKWRPHWSRPRSPYRHFYPKLRLTKLWEKWTIAAFFRHQKRVSKSSQTSLTTT